MLCMIILRMFIRFVIIFYPSAIVFVWIVQCLAMLLDTPRHNPSGSFWPCPRPLAAAFAAASSAHLTRKTRKACIQYCNHHVMYFMMHYAWIFMAFTSERLWKSAICVYFQEMHANAHCIIALCWRRPGTFGVAQRTRTNNSYHYRGVGTSAMHWESMKLLHPLLTSSRPQFQGTCGENLQRKQG